MMKHRTKIATVLALVCAVWFTGCVPKPETPEKPPTKVEKPKPPIKVTTTPPLKKPPVKKPPKKDESKARAIKQVDTLLAMIPTASASDQAKMVAFLRALDEAAMRELCSRVKDPFDTDGPVRMALFGLTNTVAVAGNEKQRAVYLGVLVEEANKKSSREIRACMVRHLGLIGDASVAPALGKLLCDETLCDEAARSLLSIGDGAAPEFRKALTQCEGRCQTQIVVALGRLRDAKSSAAIAKLAASPERDVRLTALEALAEIGAANAEGAIVTRSTSDDRYERGKATAALTHYIERRAEEGDDATADRLCRELIATRAGEGHVQTAALASIVGRHGDDAFDDLLAATASEDATYRASAMEIALSMKGASGTKRWADALPKASPDARAEIVRMLGRRGDASAAPAVIARLKDPKADVRMMAYPAAAALSGVDAIGPIAKALSDVDATERDAAKGALVSIAGDPAVDAMAGALASAPLSARVVLIEAITERGGTKHIGRIIGQTRSADTDVRVAALEAIGEMGGAEHLPKTLDLLVKARDKAERSAAERAAVAVSRRVKGAERSEALTVAFKSAKGVEPKAAVLRVMSKTGDRASLKVVREALKSDNADAAVRAMAEWPSSVPMADLLAIAKESESPIHRVLALRGYLRMAGLPSKRPAAEKVAALQQGMDLATRDDERRLAIAGFANVADPQALMALEPFLERGSLKAEAVAAVVKVASALGKSHPDLAIAALKRAKEVAPTDATKKAATSALNAWDKAPKSNDASGKQRRPAK